MIETRKILRTVDLLAGRMLAMLVRVYQITIGQWMGGHCRFHPTCSNYGLEALRTHGALRGSWLTIVRILKCHPLHDGGVDLVPPVKHVHGTAAARGGHR